jgi:hypothetical protein
MPRTRLLARHLLALLLLSILVTPTVLASGRIGPQFHRPPRNWHWPRPPYWPPAPASDVDGDGIPDCDDDCREIPNPDQADADGDRMGDACDPCPLVPGRDCPPAPCECPPGSSFIDADGDGVFEICISPDQITTTCDNCPAVANPDQADRDGDGVGDACDMACECNGTWIDADQDGAFEICLTFDGLSLTCDNCPAVANPDQADADGDGVGDACDMACECNGTWIDADQDGAFEICLTFDGLSLTCDNCPELANPDQADGDDDGIGDACDGCPTVPGPSCDPSSCDCPPGSSIIDRDGDGIFDICISPDFITTTCDNCPDVANADQVDGDGDGIGDACDDCPVLANRDQGDGDLDGIGDACDPCPTIPGSSCIQGRCDCPPGGVQQDIDGDGAWESCVAPGVNLSGCDNCPDLANPDQADSDGDGIGDACDN